MNVIEVSALTFSIQAFVTLLVILDPPGATPIFLGLVADKTQKERVRLAWQAALVSLVVITFFSLFGRLLLEYMSVSIEALQAAGGLLLLYVSLELLTGRDMGGESAKDKNIALVPLGTPLLAGPGAIVATMIFVQQIETPAQSFGLIAAVVGVHIVIAVSLMASTTILSIIKDSGVTLLARIAGLLLAAIAVQMLVDAIRAFSNQ
ncbi:MAG: MarC family protein [Candidatus Planktophila sp.]|jgi:multiple antibiotic resistance protein|tara:strand:+ start:8122 stop:8739 length:618 start_codon:yes stop_codon:yes gene_type:complete